MNRAYALALIAAIYRDGVASIDESLQLADCLLRKAEAFELDHRLAKAAEAQNGIQR